MIDNPIAGANEETVHVFVSYAREDSRWLEPNARHNLVPFLIDSLRRYKVVFWFDHDLKPGDEFRQQIKSKIDQSQIALLIVSQCFLNSAFIESEEMPRISERALEGKMIVVPVLVEPCDWSDYPFLADRQMVPSSPLIDYTESESSWAKVKYQILDGIKAQVKRIRELSEQPAKRVETPEPRRPEPIKFDLKPDPVRQEPVRQEPVKQEPVKQDPVKPDPTRQDAGQRDPGPIYGGGGGVSGGGAYASTDADALKGGVKKDAGLSGGIWSGGGTQKATEEKKKIAAVTLSPTGRIVAWCIYGGGLAVLLIIAIFVRVHSGSSTSDDTSISSDDTSLSASSSSDDSMSLADTLQYIQDKMSDNRLSFTANVTNTTDSSTFTTSYVELTSNVSADATQCRISYHWAEWMNNADKPSPDVDAAFVLKDVDTITVEPMRQNIADANADAGKTNYDVTSTDPDVTAILVHRSPSLINEIAFTDADLANNVAKAISHAVTLCGGNATLKD
jgi:hypothetical protein